MSGQIQSGIPGSFGPAPILGDGYVQFNGPDGKKIFWDTLSESDQNIVIQFLLNAQFPLLVPPQELVNSSSNSQNVSSVTAAGIAVVSDRTKHDIIMGMLDGWIENIQRIAEQSKRDDEKRVIEGMSTAFHAYQHQASLETDTNFPLFALGMVIAGTGVHQALLPNPTMSDVQFNPVVDMSNKVMVQVPGDMRAELGLIGAIYATGIQYFTLAQITSEEVGKEEKLKNGDFAKGYAENIVGLVNSPSFNSYLTAIVTRSLAKGEPLGEETLKTYTSMIKIVLLSSALAMLYQAEAGKMTSIEFAGMLSGNIKFAIGSLHSTLIGLIKSNLNALSASEKEQVIASLLEYFDSNPSIESLSNPAKVFAGIYQTLPQAELGG